MRPWSIGPHSGTGAQRAPRGTEFLGKQQVLEGIRAASFLFLVSLSPMPFADETRGDGLLEVFSVIRQRDAKLPSSSFSSRVPVLAGRGAAGRGAAMCREHPWRDPRGERVALKPQSSAAPAALRSRSAPVLASRARRNFCQHLPLPALRSPNPGQIMNEGSPALSGGQPSLGFSLGDLCEGAAPGCSAWLSSAPGSPRPPPCFPQPSRLHRGAPPGVVPPPDPSVRAETNLPGACKAAPEPARRAAGVREPRCRQAGRCREEGRGGAGGRRGAGGTMGAEGRTDAEGRMGAEPLHQPPCSPPSSSASPGAVPQAPAPLSFGVRGMLARRELSPRVSRCLVSSIRAGLVASVLVLNLSGSSMNTDLLYPPRQWDFTGVLAPLEGTVFCFFFFKQRES